MLTMSRIPLHTLPSFRVIARTGNLRAAADELHLTHSAVSQQMRLLETQLGFELFDRRARRIVLNAAGAALLQAIESGAGSSSTTACARPRPRPRARSSGCV